VTDLTGILYSPDARSLWLYTKFRAVGLRDARTAEPLLPLPTGTLPLALSLDGRHLAASADARRVQVWDLVGGAIDWTPSVWTRTMSGRTLGQPHDEGWPPGVGSIPTPASSS